MISCVKNLLKFRSLAYSSAYCIQYNTTLFLVIITSSKLRKPSAEMGMKILLWEAMGTFLYTTMGMGIRSWEWDRKSHSRTLLI